MLGAVAVLCFALIDSSCEEVTAYREDAPIDTCTEMLASFSCRTADYNRTAGTGFSKIFSTKPRAWRAETPPRKNTAIDLVGLCGSRKEGVFTCQTSEYDNTGVPKNRTAYENWDKIDNGSRRTFERDACPSDVPHAAVSWVYAAHPANTSNLFSDTKFRARPRTSSRAQKQKAGDKGQCLRVRFGTGPREFDSTQSMEVTETYPAEECRSAIPDIDGNDKFTCRTSDYDEDAGTGFQGTYSITYVPDMFDLRCPNRNGTVILPKLTRLVYEDILGVHPAAAHEISKLGQTSHARPPTTMKLREVDTSRTLAILLA